MQRIPAARSLCLVVLLPAVLTAALGSCSGPTRRGSADAPTLFVVRHAEAWKNVEATPSPESVIQDSLTPTGRAGAAVVGASISSRARIDAIYSSPAVRAVQTAEAIASKTGAPVFVVTALRPLENGEISWDERYADWRRGEDARPAGGESMQDGIERALDLTTLAPDQSIVLVGHGGITAGTVAELRDDSDPERWTVHALANGGYVGFRRGAEGRWVEMR